MMHQMFFSPFLSNILIFSMSITLLALEFVTMDTPIIGEASSYHLATEIPSQSSSSLIDTNLLEPCTPSLANPTSINGNTSLIAMTIPFTSLTSSNKSWSIQGRFIAKTNIHEYSNKLDLGKVFGFDLVNASHDEIHISAFNELETSLYDQIQIWVVYMHQIA